MGTFLPAHGFCQCSSKRLECCDLKSSFAFSKAMPSKREKRDKSRKEDKNTANKKRRAAAKRFKADVPSGEEPMRDINPADAASASPLGPMAEAPPESIAPDPAAVDELCLH